MLTYRSLILWRIMADEGDQERLWSNNKQCFPSNEDINILLDKNVDIIPTAN